MQGIKVFSGLLVLALFACIANGQEERKCKTTGRTFRQDPECKRTTQWQVVKENEETRVTCRCVYSGILLKIRECVTCKYQNATTTTEAPIETTQEPIETTQEPIETTQEPIETTQGPIETTQEVTTVEPIETSIPTRETSLPPIETTLPSVETSAPTVETSAPTVETTVPVETTQEGGVTSAEPIETSTTAGGIETTLPENIDTEAPTATP